MPKRKKRRAPVKRRRTYAKKNPRRRTNPRKRRTVRRAGQALARGFMGLDIKGVLQKTPWALAGMMAAKWAAKRFDPDATETDPTTWNWSSYVKGALGAVGAAVLCNSVKRGKGKTVLEGGIYLMAYKAMQNELIPASPWAVEQFGAEDWTDLDGLGAGDESYVPTEYLLTGDDDDPYGYDDMGEMFPVDDRHRLPTVTEMDGALEPIGPLGGGALEPVGPLGFGADPFAEAYLG